MNYLLFQNIDGNESTSLYNLGLVDEEHVTVPATA